METFCPTIVCGCVRGSKKMKDASLSAELTKLQGRKFAIVSDEAFEFVWGLKLNSCQPMFENGGGFTLVTEWKGPNEA